MKRIVILSSAVAIMLASVSIAVHSYMDSKIISQLINNDIEALAYSNEGPGGPGEKQKQAVWCGGGGWIVKVGCCYGGSQCNEYHCSGHSYSCDGNTWLKY